VTTEKPNKALLAVAGVITCVTAFCASIVPTLVERER
jgi:hypothetical protein